MGETMQPSLLEQLRQRLQQDIAPPQMSANERLAAMGRGILSNRGSLLDNLSAGLAAQNQAMAARREEARKAAELEAEIVRRDEEMRLKQEELRNPDISALRQAQAFYYRQRPEMAGAGAAARMRVTPAVYTTMYNQAENAALRQYPDPPPGTPEPESAKQERLANRARYRDERLQRLLEGSEQIQSGQLPSPQPAQPQQGPGQRVQVPLTGTPR